MKSMQIPSPIHDFQDETLRLENTDFRVKVDGVPVTAYKIRCSAVPFNRIHEYDQRTSDQSEILGFINFEGTGEVLVEVETDKAFSSAVVRPLSKGVSVQKDGGRVAFTLKKHGQYALELDDMHTCLEVFYNEEKSFAPKEEYTHYFGAGIHIVGLLNLRDGESVYIDRDAIVYGGIYAKNVDNIRIEGYGTVDGSILSRVTGYDLKKVEDTGPFMNNRGDIMLVNCKNIRIEGVTLVNSAFWVASFFNCENIEIENIKITGQWRYNTDGIDLVSCRNVEIKNSYIHVFDDVITIKAYSQFDRYTIHTVENIRVDNCVLWCGWGRTIEIGIETVAREYKNILFENCDLIHNSASAIDIQNGDCAFVHDFVVRNCNVEFQCATMPEIYQATVEQKYDGYGQIGMPYLIWIDNHKYGSMRGEYSDRRIAYAGGEGIFAKVEDVTIENIRVFGENGLPRYKIKVFSLGEDVVFKNIKIKNITIDGRLATKDDFDLEIDERTENLELL